MADEAVLVTNSYSPAGSDKNDELKSCKNIILDRSLKLANYADRICEFDIETIYTSQH